MAKVSVEFDTVSKELNVTMDGTPVENVREVCCYSYEDNKGNVEIRTVENMSDDGMIKVVRILANEITEEKIESNVRKDIQAAVKRALGRK